MLASESSVWPHIEGMQSKVAVTEAWQAYTTTTVSDNLAHYGRDDQAAAARQGLQKCPVWSNGLARSRFPEPMVSGAGAGFVWTWLARNIVERWGLLRHKLLPQPAWGAASASPEAEHAVQTLEVPAPGSQTV